MSLPIAVHDDLLPLPLVQSVARHLERLGWNYGWKSSDDRTFGHWHIDLCRTGKNRFNRDDVSGELDQVVSPIWRLLQPLALPDHPVPVRAYGNLHTYGCEGYPHTDANEPGDRTAVVYLTPDWKREWGGETTFFDGQEITCAVMPKMGRVVTFPSEIFHAARSLTRICPKPRPVLVFKART